MQSEEKIHDVNSGIKYLNSKDFNEFKDIVLRKHMWFRQSYFGFFKDVETLQAELQNSNKKLQKKELEFNKLIEEQKQHPLIFLISTKA